LTTKQVERAGNSSTSDFSFSRVRFFALSAEVNRINDEPGQSLPSYDAADLSKINDYAAAVKPRVRFWANLKKIVTGRLSSNLKVD
jgi:hypothetical protein